MAKTAKTKSTTSSTSTPGKVFGPALEAATLKPIASLIPYARNSRAHSADQVAQLARSMEKFGWTMPVLIDPKGNIIAGYGRVLAAQKLGFKEVPAWWRGGGPPNSGARTSLPPPCCPRT